MVLPYDNTDYSKSGDGAKTITELNDVILTELADNHILKYNSSNEKWENVVDETTGGAFTSLDDVVISSPKSNKDFILYDRGSGTYKNVPSNINNLKNVDIDNVENKEILKYNSTGAKWENVSNNVNDLTDMTIVNIADKEIIKYNSTTSKWENNLVHLNEIFDVVIDSVANGQVLKYNSSESKWKNAENIDTLNELSDVTLGPLAQNQFLKYDYSTSKFINNLANLSDLADTNMDSLLGGDILKYNDSTSKWETNDLILNNVNDVVISSVADNQVLKYDSTASKWKNEDDNLNNVNDVVISNVANNQVLKYDSSESKWKNQEEKTHSISELSDVEIGGIGNNHLLKYNNSNQRWENGRLSLGHLNNVTLTNPTAGDYLSYNGTKYVNVPAYTASNIDSDTADILGIDIGTELGGLHIAGTTITYIQPEPQEFVNLIENQSTVLSSLKSSKIEVLGDPYNTDLLLYNSVGINSKTQDTTSIVNLIVFSTTNKILLGTATYDMYVLSDMIFNNNTAISSRLADGTAKILMRIDSSDKFKIGESTAINLELGNASNTIQILSKVTDVIRGEINGSSASTYGEINLNGTGLAGVGGGVYNSIQLTSAKGFSNSQGEYHLHLEIDEINMRRGSNSHNMYLNFRGGSVIVNQNETVTSDDRIKFNEKIITNGLDIVRQLSPQIYDKKFPNQETVVEAGFIAQEVNAIEDLSFAVKQTGKEYVEGDPETNYYALDYKSIYTYAIASIKELDTIVTRQQQENDLLKLKLNEILTEMGRENI